MNVLDSNKPMKHPGLEYFVQHSKWSFLINAHILIKAQSGYLVGYQVFSAVIMEFFSLSFKYL